MRFTKILRGTASVAVLAAFAAGASYAGAAYAQDDEINSVDELVVTAQKREQNLQDVPIVVTSLSEELLENAGVKDIKDLQILTPGLTVTSTTSETITTARIRGVGTVGDNPGLESSVGVVIDGVYRPRNGVGFGDLGEMQRIEVLKGPQGTLFGKNTSAGVINIITEAPSFEFGAEGELTAGSDGALGASASVTGPIAGDKLAGRLYVAKRERDGFYDVKTGDGPRTLTSDQDQNFWTARGQLLLLPSDSVEIRAIADYTKREENCCAAVQVRSGPTAAILNNPLITASGEGVAPAGGPTFPMLPFSRTAYSNRGTGQTVEDKGLSIEANVDLPNWNATLTSISSVRFWDSTNGHDIDYSGADILYREANGEYGFSFDTLSQEIRLAGSTDHLDWLVGGFYASEDLSRTDAYNLGADYNTYLSLILSGGANPGMVGILTGSYTDLDPGPGTAWVPSGAGPTFTAGKSALDTYDQTSKTLALFTNNTLHVTDAFDITMGLRYTMEDKDLDTHQTNPTNNSVCPAAMFNYATNRWQNLPLTAAQKQTAVGVLCLPWTNPAFNNRITHQSSEEREWSGTLKASYRFNDDIMTYVSYARGYKGGGFNLDRVQSLTPGGFMPDASTHFAPEMVDSYELGLKTTWFDNSLLLNATLFQQEYSDFQLNTFLGTAFAVETIPELTSKGVDMDLIWFAPIEGLSFQGGVTYAKTEYGKFTAADLNDPTHFPALSLLPGAQMSFAPEWSSTGAVTYERSFGAMKAGFNLSAKYTSEYNTKSDLLPAGMQDAMTLVNGRISFGSEDDRWTFELWGQNLTDVDYYQVVFNAPLQGTAFQSTLQPSGNYYNPALDTQTYNAFLGQPRTWGATLRIKY
ncbi:TonB-dependent receptor [Caulobacter sp. 17J80-11]|uniref:TonB-dependent receptor n=1 Tax=Caulobacter sp. 17J80-11 TaxID=2763502 RepID=UPI00165347D5|nr:TonB-dependent receptor [Caulobacter sp. 17J80-11]MBC6980381.1 TonB-dependent receptor [Caulobacter sp. 17J80-11]